MTFIDPAQAILSGGSAGIWRTLIFGTLAYGVLIVMLRVTGKRTLGKMNAFDLVVTVALGSTLASVLLDTSVPLLDGLVALGLLVALQFVITWTSVRSATLRRLVKSEPTLLASAGDYHLSAMRAQRVTRDEIDAALRSEGFSSLSAVRCVVLETNGRISVIR